MKVFAWLEENKQAVIAASEQALEYAREVIRLLGGQQAHLACAESLTGGALAATVVSVPGASRVLRGGAVTYATDTKASILGVSREQLQATGPVDPTVACMMAEGAAHLFAAEYALSTTGVAGPGPSDGHEEGTVCIGVYAPHTCEARTFHFPSGRDRIRILSVQAALELLLHYISSPQHMLS